jgi:hypothetical protein
MEYRVTIAVAESVEDTVVGIFDALTTAAPDLGPVMGETFPDGPTEYVLGLDATDALVACVSAVDIFRSAVASCASACGADTSIVDLRAERVPDWELQERTDLQTA